MKKINSWYKKNIGKILLLCIIFTFFTVTIRLIPYFNFLLSGGAGFALVFIAWYFLFSPSTKILAWIILGLLPLAFLSAYFQLDMISNSLGEFMYLELLLIFFNYVRGFLKDRNNVM